MNRPPARHPVFIAMACISMAGAWSTGAFEVDQAFKEPASVDRVALLRDPPDCLDVGGTRRALCLYESTLSGSSTQTAGTVRSDPMTPADATRHLAVTERSVGSRAAERPLLSTRPPGSAAAVSR